ncbi:uncharacterized protein LOC127255966 [Andrographis paniculata]|uniref:uncharacterized protein LOC127255966 n=1 Tax=Andrographis paniculata TaxID=175694 RepID=UPI0021E7B171|nr:uncharacterized protein LOC127255966 [Andrographis paniculata]
MERRRRTPISGAVAVILVASIILSNCAAVNAQRYTCWGGCYNNCFLRSNKTRPEMLSCYYQCLNKCVPRSPADYQYYCRIGCSLELCAPAANGMVQDWRDALAVATTSASLERMNTQPTVAVNCKFRVCISLYVYVFLSCILFCAL